jgi:hypothetical protein
MTDEDNIKRLPVRFKKPVGEEGRALQLVDRFGECNHRSFFRSSGDGSLSGQLLKVTYVIREGETEVECGNCHTKLDPIWVLRNLAVEESTWARARERYQDEMKRLRDRSYTRCEHCGKMTKISHAKAK